MKELVLFLAKQLVNHPDAVEVKETQGGHGVGAGAQGRQGRHRAGHRQAGTHREVDPDHPECRRVAHQPQSRPRDHRREVTACAPGPAFPGPRSLPIPTRWPWARSSARTASAACCASARISPTRRRWRQGRAHPARARRAAGARWTSTHAAPHGRGVVLLGLDGVVRPRRRRKRCAARVVLVRARRPPRAGRRRVLPSRASLGFAVETLDGAVLGTIAGVMANGINDVWVVRAGDARAPDPRHRRRRAHDRSRRPARRASTRSPGCWTDAARATSSPSSPSCSAARWPSGRSSGARELGVLEVSLHQLRDYAADRHLQVDDVPYGGGPGMVMKAEPLVAAIEHVSAAERPRRVLLAARGRRFDQRARRRAGARSRACSSSAGATRASTSACARASTRSSRSATTSSRAASCGALVVLDAIARLLPGVARQRGVGPPTTRSPRACSSIRSTRVRGRSAAPRPRRPAPGDHAAIARWRREQMLRTTLARRPDLLHAAALDDADRALLRALGWEPRGRGRPDDG